MSGNRQYSIGSSDIRAAWFSLGIIGTIFTAGVAIGIIEKKYFRHEYKILPIKSIDDKDNIPGNETLILEDGKAYQIIKDRNGNLSLLEKSAEALK